MSFNNSGFGSTPFNSENSQAQVVELTAEVTITVSVTTEQIVINKEVVQNSTNIELYTTNLMVVARANSPPVTTTKVEDLNADFSTGTLTSVVALNDSLQLSSTATQTNYVKNKSLATSYYNLTGSIYGMRFTTSSSFGTQKVTRLGFYNNAANSASREVRLYDYATGNVVASAVVPAAAANGWYYADLATPYYLQPSKSYILALPTFNGITAYSAAPTSSAFMTGITYNDWRYINAGTGMPNTTTTLYIGIGDMVIENASYSTSGNRVAPSLSVPVGATSSVISWTATTPASTSVAIQTSVNGGSTWDTVTNGSSIPNLSGATNLLVKESLTGTTSATPTLDRLQIDMTVPGVSSPAYNLREDEISSIVRINTLAQKEEYKAAVNTIQDVTLELASNVSINTISSAGVIHNSEVSSSFSVNASNEITKSFRQTKQVESNITISNEINEYGKATVNDVLTNGTLVDAEIVNGKIQLKQETVTGTFTRNALTSIDTTNETSDSLYRKQYGYEFTVGQYPITANKLGFFNSDSISVTYPVQLWDTATKTLLAEANVTVTPGVYGYSSISATSLTVGKTYTVVVNTFNKTKTYAVMSTPSSAVWDDSITYVRAVYGNALSSSSCPATADTTIYFAPQVQYDVAKPIQAFKDGYRTSPVYDFSSYDEVKVSFAYTPVANTGVKVEYANASTPNTKTQLFNNVPIPGGRYIFTQTLTSSDGTSNPTFSSMSMIATKGDPGITSTVLSNFNVSSSKSELPTMVSKSNASVNTSLDSIKKKTSIVNSNVTINPSVDKSAKVTLETQSNVSLNVTNSLVVAKNITTEFSVNANASTSNKTTQSNQSNITLSTAIDSTEVNFSAKVKGVTLTVNSSTSRQAIRRVDSQISVSSSAIYSVKINKKVDSSFGVNSSNSESKSVSNLVSQNVTLSTNNNEVASLNANSSFGLSTSNDYIAAQVVVNEVQSGFNVNSASSFVAKQTKDAINGLSFSTQTDKIQKVSIDNVNNISINTNEQSSGVGVRSADHGFNVSTSNEKQFNFVQAMEVVSGFSLSTSTEKAEKHVSIKLKGVAVDLNSKTSAIASSRKDANISLNTTNDKIGIVSMSKETSFGVNSLALGNNDELRENTTGWNISTTVSKSNKVTLQANNSIALSTTIDSVKSKLISNVANVTLNTITSRTSDVKAVSNISLSVSSLQDDNRDERNSLINITLNTSNDIPFYKKVIIDDLTKGTQFTNITMSGNGTALVLTRNYSTNLYNPSGIRTQLYDFRTYDRVNVKWTQTAPAGTTLKVEYSYNNSNWFTLAQNQSMNASLTFYIRATMTSNGSSTPSFGPLTFTASKGYVEYTLPTAISSFNVNSEKSRSFVINGGVKYAVNNVREVNIDNKYRIYKPLESNFDIKHVVSKVLSANFDTKYRVNVVHADTINTKYVVSIVSDTLTTLKYQLHNRYDKLIDTKTTINNVRTIDITNKYAINKSYEINADTKWAIIQDALLNFPLTVYYTITQPLNYTIETKFNVSKVVDNIIDGKYLIFGATTKEIRINGISDRITSLNATIERAIQINGISNRGENT